MFNCIIYNRWGLKFYEWNDEAGFWNGKTPDGSATSDGTYFMRPLQNQTIFFSVNILHFF